MDKEIEYDNLVFKIDIYSFKGEIIDRSIVRLSYLIGFINEIFFVYDNFIYIWKLLGKYIEMFIEDDVMMLVD